MNAWKLYFRSMGIHFRSAAQYKASMVMQMLALFVMTATELATVALTFRRFPALGQWSPQQIYFFFGLMSFTFGLVECFCRGFTAFGGQVRTGSFDRLLLRPRNLELLVLCSQMDVRRIGSMVVGLAALVYGAAAAQVQWTALKVLALLFALAGGGCLVLGLFMIEATATFWSISSIEVVNVLTYGGRSTCQYPVDIYPRGFRWIFIALAPYGLAIHLPAAYILDQTMLGLPPWAAFIGPLAGVAFLCLMLALWRRGVAHYTSTGS